MKPFVYPPMPKGVDEKIIQPSPAFKKEVFKVAGAILFFLITYFLLLTGAVLLAGLCAYAGFMLVIALPKFFTLMIGLGLAGMGLMVIFFLFKFIFKRNKTDRSSFIEVTEQEQPELFRFIRQITQETRAPFPKKIYLSDDVNAAVFYDSSFWSMFFPVKKNLQIGLGLVNSLNVSEFKAVLAHEFGHFSQRSMKLGSYVYNVNQVIYNLLFDNDGYGQALEKWAASSWYFSLFARITVKIVQGIQWILQKVYTLVNKSYLGLSRQMEFHADAVAAYVTGANHLVTALRRVEVADIAYHKLLAHYNNWITENLKPDNAYPHHLELMQHFAVDYNIPVTHGLPQVTAHSMSFFNYSRLVIKDQWASHPSTDDREAHLQALHLETETVHDPAWLIFKDHTALQKRITQKLFETVTFSEIPVLLDAAMFRSRFLQAVADSSFNQVYKGFYDNRPLTEFNPVEVAAEEGDEMWLNWENLMQEKHLNLPKYIAGLQEDIATVSRITKGEIEIKTFDFEGQKYSKKEAGTLLATLEHELDQLEKQLQHLDKKVFRFFYFKAQEQGRGNEVTTAYTNLFAVVKEADTDQARYQKILEVLQPIFNHNLTQQQALQVLDELKIYEQGLKERIKQILNEPGYESILNPKQKATLNEFLVQDWTYIRDHNFDNDALGKLGEVLHLYVWVATERCFRQKKEVLENQLNYTRKTVALQPDVAL